jgi:osmotically-inducible protein OsmY
MADRYEDRYRGEPYRGERGYGREERGFMDRAGDQVRSWFGNEEAERRRRDERERERDRERDWRERGSQGERGWAGERSGEGERDRERERWTGDYGRTEYDRPGAGSTGYRGEMGYGTRYGGGYTDMSGTAGEPYTRRGGGYGIGETGRRADFAGRGPKGYQRSDTRIYEDVCDRLADAPDIDASDIEVNVDKGEVRLSGTVPDREDKRRTEDIIENISGVREVHNNLRVSRWQQGTTGAAAGTTSGATPGQTKR